MALIVEDGSGVVGADSYVSEADAALIAAKYGWPLAASPEIDLRNAAQFLETYRNMYQGTKLFTWQPLQWPRTPVCIDNVLIESDTIPEDLKNAQVSVASAISSGSKIYGTGQGSVSSRSVGDVSISIGNSGSLDNSAYLGLTNSLLKPLLKNANLGALEFRVCRA